MKGQLKRILAMLLCAMMLASTAACGQSDTSGKKTRQEKDDSDEKEDKSKKKSSKKDEDTKEDDTETSKKSGGVQSTVIDHSKRVHESTGVFIRPVLLTDAAITKRKQRYSHVQASSDYRVEKGLKNITNLGDYYLMDEQKKQLEEDGFYVYDTGMSEFFEIYEDNRYVQKANFITVDSLMHSYHLYYAHLLREIEKNKLFDLTDELTDRMLLLSAELKEEMEECEEDTEYTKMCLDAADRNIVFFAVAKALLHPEWDPGKDGGLSGDALRIAQEELELVNSANGIAFSPLSAVPQEMEDYTQYKVRGYYELDEKLGRYFRAMMWYGRRNFRQSERAMDMSALLMTLAMDDKAYGQWGVIYAVTSFFAGAADDNGVCEYQPLIEDAFGKGVNELDGYLVISDQEGFERFHELTEKLEPPAINSVPMMDDGGETDKKAVNAGFRFMGQRFSLDAAIFQKLIYSEVLANADGDKRTLPDPLDVPAALGSEEALEILTEDKDAYSYPKYEENMKELRKTIEDAPDESWTVSLYAGWLNTLRPLLDEKGEEYPEFMKSEKWARKDLECFLGSYTELKHDTILYSKQVIAEMGGDDIEDKDDRGYVEPEPEVYARFVQLADATTEGLDSFGLLDGTARTDLQRLSNIASTLEAISDKELADMLPTDEEFEFIRSYGGEIEHFWQEAFREDAGKDEFTAREFPAALVVDVATDPNGAILELANGNVSQITVCVKVDGKMKIATGSVYNYYQFSAPLDGRMTDSEWRVQLGIDADENGEYHWEEALPDKEDWTMDYRVPLSWR